jgi:hypothetical protein
MDSTLNIKKKKAMLAQDNLFWNLFVSEFSIISYECVELKSAWNFFSNQSTPI